MAKFDIKTSIKHLQIDKANARIMIAIAATSAIVVFSIVASRALLVQMSYQNKVISLRSKANKQLVTNIKATTPLVTAYESFENSTESIIGTADKNSKIILDALPSKYDFPALATSLNGLVVGSGAKTNSITGTDDEIAATQTSISPKPIEIPFQLNVTGNYTTAQKLISDLEKSIRPIKISKLTVTGSESNLQLSVSAITYYQPAKELEIDQKVITNGKVTTTKVEVNKATQ